MREVISFGMQMYPLTEITITQTSDTDGFRFNNGSTVDVVVSDEIEITATTPALVEFGDVHHNIHVTRDDTLVSFEQVLVVGCRGGTARGTEIDMKASTMSVRKLRKT